MARTLLTTTNVISGYNAPQDRQIFVKANDIEKILYDANLWSEKQIEGERYCGTFYSGTDFAL